MPKFEIDLPHTLSLDEARARLSAATAGLERSYGAKSTWEGARDLVVTRKGLDARLRIEDTRLHVALSLGFLLTPFAEKIRAGIAKQLGEVLRPAPTPSGSPAA